MSRLGTFETGDYIEYKSQDEEVIRRFFSDLLFNRLSPDSNIVKEFFEVVDRKKANEKYEEFDFYDIVLLSDADLKTALNYIDMEELAGALKRSNKTIRDKVFSNLSKDTLSILENIMRGIFTLKEIVQAQEKITYDLRYLGYKNIINLNNLPYCDLPSEINTVIEKYNRIYDTFLNFVKNYQFRFEDILLLSDSDIKIILSLFDKELYVLRFSKATEVFEHMCSLLSQSALDMLKEDIEYSGPISKSCILEMQEKILYKICELIALEDIVISDEVCATFAKRPKQENELAIYIKERQSCLNFLKKQGIKFNDISMLSDRDFGRLLRDVSSSTAAYAIMICTPEMRNKVFRNVSKRAGEELRKKMYLMLPATVKDVREAQEEFVEIIEDLSEYDEIDYDTIFDTYISDYDIFTFEKRSDPLENFIQENIYEYEKAFERMKDKKFEFDDIAFLADVFIKKLLQEISFEELTIALQRGSEDTKNKFYQNMSKRISGVLKNDIESLENVSEKDVDLAMKNIVSTVMDLEKNGELIIFRTKDDMLVTKDDIAKYDIK